MITSTLTFAMHVLVSSYKVLAPVAHILEHILPYTRRNMASSAIKGKNNFNSKHLKRGDPLPPYNGKLRIYNMRYCPFAQRTILALNAKEIDYEIVNIDLVEKPEWLTRKSPLAKVPSLEVKEDVVIYESLITVEYLDEQYPQRPLLPKDPVKRALDKILVETTMGAVHAIFFKVLKAPDSVNADVVNAYYKSLSILEEIISRGTPFLSGNEPGYADYMIWPWLEKIDAIKDFDDRLNIDPANFKNMVEYISRMFRDPVVSEYLVPANILVEFFKGYKAGYPNYELLNQN